MSREKYHEVMHSKRAIFFNNLIGGIAWGIGATLGLAIFLTILGLIMSTIDLVPIIGPFATDVYNYVLENGTESTRINVNPYGN